MFFTFKKKFQSWTLWVLLVGVLVSGCDAFRDSKHTLPEDILRFTFDDFGEVQHMIGQPVGLDSLHKARNVYVIDDHFLLYDGFSENHHAHLYDMEGNRTFHLGEDGSSPGQLVSFGSADYWAKERILWIHDVVQQCWNGYKLDSLIAGALGGAFVKTILFEQRAVFYPQWISSDTIAYLVLNDNRGRIFYADSAGRFLAARGKTPPKKAPNVPDNVHAEAHQGLLFPFPDRDGLLFVSRYSDLVTVYNAQGIKQVHLAGPTESSVVGSVVEMGDERHFAITPETKTGINSAGVTRKHLYLMYAGKSEQMAPQSEPAPGWWKSTADELLVLTRAGKPLARYELDHLIISLAIDTAHNYLYGLDFQEQKVYQYELPTH